MDTVITTAAIGDAVAQSDKLKKAYAASAVATFVAKCNHVTATEKGARKGAKLAESVFTPEIIATARAAERTPADQLKGLLSLTEG